MRSIIWEQERKILTVGVVHSDSHNKNLHFYSIFRICPYPQLSYHEVCGLRMWTSWLWRLTSNRTCPMLWSSKIAHEVNHLKKNIWSWLIVILWETQSDLQINLDQGKAQRSIFNLHIIIYRIKYLQDCLLFFNNSSARELNTLCRL